MENTIYSRFSNEVARLDVVPDAHVAGPGVLRRDSDRHVARGTVPGILTVEVAESWEDVSLIVAELKTLVYVVEDG